MPTVDAISTPVNVMDDALCGMRVVVMGLGRFGGGVGVSRFLASRGARVLVTDSAKADSLISSTAALADLNVELRLGRHDSTDLDDAELLVVSPAVNTRTSAFVHDAIARRIPWTTEINLFLARCESTIVGITGSVGKSTSCAMLDAIAIEAVKRKSIPYDRVVLGGNIGRSLLETIDDLTDRDLIILELSSFQLEYVRTDSLRPQIAVITNVAPHHLDRHETMRAYLDAKLNLLRGQCPGQHVILGSDVEALLTAARRISEQRGTSIRTVGPPDQAFQLKLAGSHNQHNAAIAAAAAHSLGISNQVCRDALMNVMPLAHRLATIAESNGVTYINDSKSTSASSLATALRAIETPVILLCGGKYVDVEVNAISRLDLNGVRAAASFGEAGPALHSAMVGRLGDSARCFDRLDDAIGWAHAMARSGDCVLLSPGLPSYDAFTNYEARGDAFAQIVAALIR